MGLPPFVVLKKQGTVHVLGDFREEQKVNLKAFTTSKISTGLHELEGFR